MSRFDLVKQHVAKALARAGTALSTGARLAYAATLKAADAMTLAAAVKRFPWVFGLAALSIVEAFVILLLVIF